MKALKGDDFKARDGFEMNKAKEIGNKDAKGVSLDFKKAMEFYQLALTILKDTGEKDGIATMYAKLAPTYQSLSEFKKAIGFYQLALRIAKDTGNKDGEAAIYNNLGTAYQSLSVFQKANEFYQVALLKNRKRYWKQRSRRNYI